MLPPDSRIKFQLGLRNWRTYSCYFNFRSAHRNENFELVIFIYQTHILLWFNAEKWSIFSTEIASNFRGKVPSKMVYLTSLRIYIFCKKRTILRLSTLFSRFNSKLWNSSSTYNFRVFRKNILWRITQSFLIKMRQYENRM